VVCTTEISRVCCRTGAPAAAATCAGHYAAQCPHIGQPLPPPGREEGGGWAPLAPASTCAATAHASPCACARARCDQPARPCATIHAAFVGAGAPLALAVPDGGGQGGCMQAWGVRVGGRAKGNESVVQWGLVQCGAVWCSVEWCGGGRRAVCKVWSARGAVQAQQQPP